MTRRFSDLERKILSQLAVKKYLGVPKTALGMIFKSAFILLRTATKGQQHDADITLLPRIAHIRPDRLNQNEDCRLRGEEIARENIEELKRLVSG